MISLFITECKKIRRRHIGMLFAATWIIDFIWMHWAMGRGLTGTQFLLGQEYYYLLLNLPIINAIFMPTILASAASRLCDIELKGNALKMLCTMEPRQSIFHTKLLVGAMYVLLFSLAQTAMIPLLCMILPTKQTEMPLTNVLLYGMTTFGVSMVLLIIQQTLSLLSKNQLFPLFFGVGGSFAGIFFAFFPQIPPVLPWTYYYALCTVNMHYSQSMRDVTYYLIPFRTGLFLGFMVFGVLAYVIGKRLFMQREI